MIVDLDTGRRRDIVHSTFNYGMNSYGLDLPGLLVSEDGDALLAVGAGVDATRFERYVKFKFGMPYPSLMRFDLRGMPWRTVPVDNAEMVAAAGQGDLALMQRLVDQGASVDSGPTLLGNALWTAASAGKAEAVSWLLDHGASLAAASASGAWTPLEVAAMNGHAEVVRRLLQAGQPPGRAMERATEFKRTDVIEVLKAATRAR